MRKINLEHTEWIAPPAIYRPIKLWRISWIMRHRKWRWTVMTGLCALLFFFFPFFFLTYIQLKHTRFLFFLHPKPNPTMKCIYFFIHQHKYQNPECSLQHFTSNGMDVFYEKVWKIAWWSHRRSWRSLSFTFNADGHELCIWREEAATLSLFATPRYKPLDTAYLPQTNPFLFAIKCRP